MKRMIAWAAALLLAAQALPALAAPEASDPIASGTINRVTYVRWGKSEMFPILGMVGPGTELDVYEYDKDWVMVLYDTFISQGYSTQAHSFYGFVKRTDITCDPELEGDSSPKADTGPGKRKGKKPKPKPTAGASAEPSAPQESAPAESAAPEPTVETVEDEEYDWIIRTPGLCNVTVQYQEATLTCSFALMAQKAGGMGPSSDPAYNHGIRTPYAATAFYGMVASMQDMLDNMGAPGMLQGSGGIEITGQAAGATFFIDTASLDPALVNFTVNLEATGVLNPKITDGQITGEFEQSVNMQYPLPVQLKKVGNGYKFVLPGMRPGGGNLEFPAVLEKTFADPERWDKEAKEADRRREEAERLRKEMLEKLKKQMEDEYKKKQQEQDGEDTESTDPMVVEGEDGEDVTLAPLVTEDPLAPLVTEDPLAQLVTEDPLAQLVTEDPLAPLTPANDEEVDSFPSRK